MTGDTKPRGLSANIEHVTSLNTRSAVLPISKPGTPVRPATGGILQNDTSRTSRESNLPILDRLRADVVGAAAVGLRTASITRRVPDADAALGRHEGPPPDHVIADLSELVALIAP